MTCKKAMVRKRLNIPEASKEVLAWMDAQTSSDISIRLLITDFIKVHGLVDRADMTDSGSITTETPRKNVTFIDPKDEIFVPVRESVVSTNEVQDIEDLL